MNSSSGETSLPDPRVMKMKCLLTKPECEKGYRSVRKGLMRELAGLSHCTVTAKPTMREKSPAAAAFLPESDEGTPYAQQKKDSESVEMTGLRTFAELPCGGSCESSLEGLLTPWEFRAMLGTSARLRHIGGDAAGRVDGSAEARVFAMEFRNKSYIMV